MKVNVYAIWDKCTEFYHCPLFIINDKSAKRRIDSMMRKGENVYFEHPEDFNLWKIGTFDDHDGGLVKCTPTLVFELDALANELHV